MQKTHGRSYPIKTALVLGVAYLFVTGMSESNKLAQYAEGLKAAISSIEKKEPPAKIEKQVKPLYKLSQSIVANYAKRNTDCAEYLGKTLKAADSLPKMSIEQIEKDYHADGALPKAPAHCYHVKDLMVHPATVLILLKSKDDEIYNKMHNELAELDVHLKLVQNKLKNETAANSN